MLIIFPYITEFSGPSDECPVLDVGCSFGWFYNPMMIELIQTLV